MFKLKYQFARKTVIFQSNYLRSGFVANVKWREQPGFGMVHHKCFWDNTVNMIQIFQSYQPYFRFLGEVAR